jgi:hypothetical protein
MKMKGRMTPSLGLWEPRSSEAIFVVHENAKNLNLEVTPDDTTLNLQDAVTRRVQWRRTSIDVDPAAISASTIPSLSYQHNIPSQSQPHTIPSLSPPKNTPSQSRPQTTPTMPQS